MILFFMDGMFLQAAENITRTEEKNEEEREIPENPSRPKSINDEWKGSYVYFGTYNGHALRWRVLKNDGENLLLMTDGGVGYYPYHDVGRLGEFKNTWESSTLREFLNGEFIYKTFSQEEKEYLQVNYVRNGYSSSESFDSGNDTEDKVYLLSAAEFRRESYGFYGTTGAAESRRFWHEDSMGKNVYEETYTRSLWGLTNGNPYAYWIGESGEFCARGSWFTHPITWSKNIHPVIKISIDCPYWKDEAQQDKEESGETEESPSDPGMEWKIQGLNFDFTIPEEMWAIGGAKVGMDYAKIPVIFSLKGNEFRIAVGAEWKGSSKDLWDLEKAEWNNVKKWYEKQDKNILNGTYLLKEKVNSGSKIISTPLEEGLSSKIAVRGYAEGTIENGEINKAGGGISIEIKVSGEKYFQTMVYVVPIVVKLKGEIGYKNEFEIGLDFDASSLYVNGDLNITFPKLRVSAGAGVAYIADVCGYGEFENNIKIQAGYDFHPSEKGMNPKSKISAVIKGQAGVSVKALCFSADKKIVDNGEGWEYWNSEKGFLPSSKSEENNGKEDKEEFFSDTENYAIQRTFYSAPDWYPEGVQRNLSEDSEEKIIRTEIYDAPEIKTVRTDQGISMMVYVEDIKERENGNHTAVVYSVYNAETGQWSEPEILQDDGTADFYPDIITDGTDIYVAWTNAKRQFTENDPDLQQMAEACEISVAKYDMGQGTFHMVNTLTENNTMDFKPALGKIEDSIGIVWLQNSENDILSFSGTNSVFYSVWDGNGWSEAKEYASFDDKAVTSASIGNAGQNSYLAFTVDNDRDYSTVNDVDLYVGELDGTPKILQIENAVEQGVKFEKISGRDILIWYGDGGLFYTADMKNDYALIQGEELSPKYQVFSDGTEDLFLFSAERKDSGTEPGTAVFASIGKNGRYSKPVQVTEGECYINGFSGLKDESGYQVLYGKTIVNMDGETIEKEVSLCKKELGGTCQLKLENVEFEEEAVCPGEDLLVQLELYNSGLKEIKKVQVTAVCNGEVIFDKSGEKEIGIGDYSNLSIIAPLPENLASNSKLQILVRPVADEEEEETEFSSMETLLGKGELALYVEENAEQDDITLEVVNEGCFTEHAVLEVKSGNKDGKLIEEFHVENLERGASITQKIKKSEIIQKFPEDKTLYFEIKNEKEEIYLSNNTAYCYIGDTKAPPVTPPKDTGKLEDTEKPENTKKPSDKNDSSENKSDGPSKDSEKRKPHKITARSSYQKTYDKKRKFYLNVSSSTGAKLKYHSSKPNIVKVSNSGYASIQGIGKSIITVTAKADNKHTESKLKITVTVKPKSPKLYGVTSLNSKKARVRWSKSPKASGYQIRYSVKKSMKSAKKKKFPGAGKSSGTLSGLKKGRKYYFQVRAYKKSGRMTYYSGWSNKRSIKIK